MFIQARRQTVYCAFCSTPHEVYKDKSIKLRHVFLSAAASGCLSFIVWREYDPKSILFFVVGLMLAEVFCRLRWRMHLTCQSCGFDPVIYKKDPNRAAELVKIFLRNRESDPRFLLKKPLNLPKRPPVDGKTLSTTV
jgi:hypothetical protein